MSIHIHIFTHGMDHKEAFLLNGEDAPFFKSTHGFWGAPTLRADVYLANFSVVCAGISQGRRFPRPLLVTGNPTVMRKAFLLGASDFHSLPGLREHLLIRASRLRKPGRVLRFDGTGLVWQPGRITGPGGTMDLSPAEESILRKFRNSIDNHFIEPWSENKRAADTLVSSLRRKMCRALGDAQNVFNPIQSVRGSGWKLNTLH